MTLLEPILIKTIFLFAILVLAALSGLFAERSGIVNIAIEGFMTFGALIYAVSGKIFSTSIQEHNNFQFLSLLIAGLSGSLISLLFAFSVINLKANQVIAGTAINLLAGGIGIYLALNSPWTETGVIRSGYISINLATSGWANNINVFFIIALALCGISYTLINLTKWGLRLKACGENPHAATAAGVNVFKTRYTALLISGFLAGVAGGMFIHKSSYIFSGSVQGYGFIGLTILIFGQWRTIFVGLAALLFSFLTAFAIESKFIDAFNEIPGEFMQMLPYVLSLATLVIFSKYSRAPRAAGQIYEYSKK